MNLNVHFHVAVPDGVFTATKGAARADFWRLPTPDRMDVETLTVNVEMRVVSWLRRHGFLNDDSSEPSAEPSARSALGVCLLGSRGLGELSALRQAPTQPRVPERAGRRPHRIRHPQTMGQRDTPRDVAITVPCPLGGAHPAASPSSDPFLWSVRTALRLESKSGSDPFALLPSTRRRRHLLA